MTGPSRTSWRAAVPHARYALLHRRDDAWDVELRAVVYAWDEAAAARAHGYDDWAVALETGLALPTVARGRA